MTNDSLPMTAEAMSPQTVLAAPATISDAERDVNHRTLP